MPDRAKANLKRPIHEMPSFVAEALRERKLEDAYRSRPAYQQNDYIGWINKARLDATKRKRLQQMLDELEGGGLYMNMSWSPKSSDPPAED